jgi:hypothetical protein
LKDGYIRLVVTRGVGYLGLNPFRCKNPTVFIIADRIELYPEEVYRKGLKLITASTQRTNPAAMSPSIKSLNYLNNILAKIEAVKSRIVGLRLGIVATAISGVVVSLFVFLLTAAVQVSSNVFGQSSGGSPGGPFFWAVVAAIPFMAICGYLSHRVNKHTDRLSRGKFEPRLVLFEDE